MTKVSEGDIVRIKASEGGKRYELYEVVSTRPRPSVMITIRAGSYEVNVRKDQLIITTRRGNRYDYNIDGSFAE